MTSKQTFKIIERLISMYPSFKFGGDIDGVEVNNPLKYWHQQIGDMDFDRADKAVMRCIDRCKFVPTAADIREEYEKLEQGEHNDQSIIKANYDYARGSYPEDVKPGYAWEEWQSRVKNGQEAVIFYDVIKQYLREIKEGENAMDFLKCVKTICRGADGKIFFKAVD